MRGTTHTGYPTSASKHVPKPGGHGLGLTFSITSSRQQADPWERTRAVPNWQARAECYEPLTAHGGGGSRCVGRPAGTVAEAVRGARREITNWADMGLIEDEEILGNMQLFPAESGETAHIGAGIG